MHSIDMSSQALLVSIVLCTSRAFELCCANVMHIGYFCMSRKIFFVGKRFATNIAFDFCCAIPVMD